MFVNIILIFQPQPQFFQSGESFKDVDLELNIFCVSISISLSGTQRWNKIPKWTDVYIRGQQGFKNLDYSLEFLMDNYDIISLEKCLNDGINNHITVSSVLQLHESFKCLIIGTVFCEYHRQNEDT